MAGETREGAAESSDERWALWSRGVVALERIADRLDQAAGQLERYGPALERAAKLADSPAAKVAAAVARPWAGRGGSG